MISDIPTGFCNTDLIFIFLKYFLNFFDIILYILVLHPPNAAADFLHIHDGKKKKNGIFSRIKLVIIEFKSTF